jgi:hypothetical protein
MKKLDQRLAESVSFFLTAPSNVVHSKPQRVGLLAAGAKVGE